ncbi:MAG: formate-dependent phosphoribosylglycinamide formyltransferase [Candidatus Kapaibacterium sp.]
MFTKKILLLGSGELGKEFVIAAKRLGQHVVAVDSYDDAPAMQVADEHEVVNMLDGDRLRDIVARHRPDVIVPEIEAIRTEVLYDFERDGVHVVPSARAANFTMNRRAIRDLAANDLDIPTAPFRYAKTKEEFLEAVSSIGIPCVVKPLMSSSGKGQSTIRHEEQVDVAWNYARAGSRGDLVEVIVEGLVPFHTEITLLTVTQKHGPTVFCPPIGHRQERGDYQESWQPCAMSPADIHEAQNMAARVTEALGGEGLWGVEFFLTDSGVVFSELSPRPHDTGMVTLAGTQNLSEFELHCRAVLGLPIPEIVLRGAGASAVVLATGHGTAAPDVTGIDRALGDAGIDVRVFGKPSTRPYRRMAVALAFDPDARSVEDVRAKARHAASCISVHPRTA